jgi:hypothetical protein
LISEWRSQPIVASSPCGPQSKVIVARFRGSK